MRGWSTANQLFWTLENVLVGGVLLFMYLALFIADAFQARTRACANSFHLRARCCFLLSHAESLSLPLSHFL